jgi:hypothetical protein
VRVGFATNDERTAKRVSGPLGPTALPPARKSAAPAVTASGAPSVAAAFAATIVPSLANRKHYGRVSLAESRGNIGAFNPRLKHDGSGLLVR